MKNAGCHRYLILLLALVMALGLLPARAELFPDGDEMDMVHWAMASAVKMLANAVDEPDSVPPEIYDDLMQISVMNPDQAFIVMMGSLQNLFETSSLSGAAAAVADAHGITVDEEYAEAAYRLKERIDAGKTGLDEAIVILNYGPHIMLASITANYVPGIFLMRGEGLAGTLTQEDAETIASFFGSDIGNILAYEGESLEKLLTLDYTVHGGNAPNYIWSTGVPSAKLIMETVCGTEKHIRALFPKIAGEPRMDQEVVMKGLFEYIIANYTLETARMVSVEMIPLLDGNGAYTFMDYVRGVVDKDLKKFPAPAVDYLEGENTDLKEDATYLIVVERNNVDTDPVAGCDMVIEAVLPPSAIPETPEAADYIIRITVDWNGGKYVQDNLEVYYAVVNTAVYDARTGVMVRNLGEYTQSFSGYLSVSSRITYLNPYRDNIWRRIAPLFE